MNIALHLVSINSEHYLALFLFSMKQVSKINNAPEDHFYSKFGGKCCSNCYDCWKLSYLKLRKNTNLGNEIDIQHLIVEKEKHLSVNFLCLNCIIFYIFTLRFLSTVILKQGRINNADTPLHIILFLLGVLNPKIIVNSPLRT